MNREKVEATCVDRIKNADNRKLRFRDIFIIQGIVVIYTMAGVAGKIASNYSFLSWRFILLYGAEIALLGIYAILWQQIIKRFDLSVAYANRSVALLWSMIWAAFLFHETVTLKNVIGAAIVMMGTMIVNSITDE